MKIAYLTAYLGKEFIEKYGKGKKFALSGPFKSLGIARSMMAAGHEVIIYSPGVTTCNASIPAFSEKEEYPEGKLIIKYCNILSKRRCDPINQVRIARFIKKEHKCERFDVLVYYNITLGADAGNGRQYAVWTSEDVNGTGHYSHYGYAVLDDQNRPNHS